MKAESNIKPNEFEIENVTKDRCDIVFFTNINETVEEEQTKYTYEIYRLNICYNNETINKIKNEYNKYLEIAKKKEYDTLAQEIRNKRNKLLEETDKEMCIDRLNIELPSNLSMTNIVSSLKQFFSGFSDVCNGKTAKYRQELRDLTEQEGFPYNVVFPEKPSTDDKESENN